MTSSIRCPSCQATHEVPESLRGQSARCRCGAVLQIPPLQAPPGAPASGAAGGIAVQCPSCGKQHRADAALAGRAVRCGCGGTFQVPGGQVAADPLGTPAANSDPFGDDWGALEQSGAPMPAAPMQQPYQAPAASSSTSPRSSGQKPGRCPKCGSRNYATPVFTWWGGFIGQRIISHVVCKKCNTAFNSKTGGSNTMAIVIYHVVIGVFVLSMFGLAGILSLVGG
jgi:hypothetical protein